MLRVSTLDVEGHRPRTDKHVLAASFYFCLKHVLALLLDEWIWFLTLCGLKDVNDDERSSRFGDVQIEKSI